MASEAQEDITGLCCSIRGLPLTPGGWQTTQEMCSQGESAVAVPVRVEMGAHEPC